MHVLIIHSHIIFLSVVKLLLQRLWAAISRLAILRTFLIPLVWWTYQASESFLFAEFGAHWVLVVVILSEVQRNFRVNNSTMLAISNTSGIASSGPLEFTLIRLIAESV